MSEHPAVEIRPRRLTLVCRGAAATVLVVFAVLAVVLPEGSSGGRAFGVADQLAFFATGVLVAATLLGFTRARVQADGAGVRVRNVRERYFPWGVVVAVTLRDGTPWAQLELHDDQTVPVLAIQANDGPLALRSLAALQQLLDQSQRPPTDSKD